MSRFSDRLKAGIQSESDQTPERRLTAEEIREAMTDAGWIEAPVKLAMIDPKTRRAIIMLEDGLIYKGERR